MIVLGVTGSIAAYKAVEVLRQFVKAGQDVQVLMSEAATHFVGPLTFQSLSGRAVLTSTLDARGWQTAHLALADQAKAVVVAPATAESLSILARGGAGDIISASLLSLPRKNGKLTTPVFLAPAMHEAMWMHPATQENVSTLKRYGYQIIAPVRGDLSRAGDKGEGRLEDPLVIAKTVLKAIAR